MYGKSSVVTKQLQRSIKQTQYTTNYGRSNWHESSFDVLINEKKENYNNDKQQETNSWVRLQRIETQLADRSTSRGIRGQEDLPREHVCTRGFSNGGNLINQLLSNAKFSQGGAEIFNHRVKVSVI